MRRSLAAQAAMVADIVAIGAKDVTISVPNRESLGRNYFVTTIPA
jgi:hypothetical protein